jgi:opacity protein-like surface antigen
MKKAFILFITMFYFLQVFGQFQLGYKLGLNISTIKNAVFGDKYNSHVSINTGLVADYEINKKYFLQAEILVSKKGFSNLLIPSGTTAQQLNYISVPVLFGYSPFKKISLLIGPEFNYLISAYSGSAKTDDTNSFQKFDIGLDAGVSYNFYKVLSLELRYNYGLSKIIKQIPNSGYPESGNNRVFQINLAYKF